MRKIDLKMDKKGLSNLIAYVMLIAITISLSVMVYGWLKFYVEGSGDAIAECPDNVNVVISSYSCFSGSNGNLTIELKNKGLFSINGFVLRVHNRTDAEFGFYVLENSNRNLGPGENFSKVYNFSNAGDNPDGLVDVTLIDVQPIVRDNGENIVCNAYASQKVVCQ